MQKAIRKLMNLFIAITMAGFIMSALPAQVLAASSAQSTSIEHIVDSQKRDAAHQDQDGQCDDGCCISHCFCAGYAIPANQIYIIPVITSSADVTCADQKVKNSTSSPQLRPPKNLA